MSLLTTRTCHFSPCRTYRYELRIIWDPSRKPQMFIGLNPSTADEENDDPTVRRCIDFAQRWGAGGLVMANACAYRATDPKAMLAFDGDRIGPENTIDYLEKLASGCINRPIAAWGKHAAMVKCFLTVRGLGSAFVDRGGFLTRFMGPLDCLRFNGDGSPCHPLYLPKDLKPIPFNYAATCRACRGTGAEFPGSPRTEKCERCDGTGLATETK